MAQAVANPLLINNKPKRTSSNICPELCKALLCVVCQLISCQSLTIHFVQSRGRDVIQVDKQETERRPFLESRLIKPAADEGILGQYFLGSPLYIRPI